MKRYHLLCTLLIIAAVSAAGCGSKSGVPTPTATPSSPSNTTSSSSSSSSSSGQSSGQPSGAVPTPSTSTPSSSKPAYEPVKLGPLKPKDTAVLGPLSFKLGSMEGRSAKQVVPGYDYFLIQVTVANTGKEEWSISSLNMFTLVEPNGKTQKINMNAGTVYPQKVDGTLAPGASKTGWLGFLVKLTDGKYKLVIAPTDLGEATYEFEAPPM